MHGTRNISFSKVNIQYNIQQPTSMVVPLQVIVSFNRLL